MRKKIRSDNFEERKYARHFQKIDVDFDYCVKN